MMSRPRSSSITRQEFSQCALVEIIHLHDCLRGALHEIQNEVDSLVQVSSRICDEIENGDSKQKSDDATPAATTEPPNTAQNDSSTSSSSSILTIPNEDHTNANNNNNKFEVHIASDLAGKVASRFHLIWSVFRAHSGAEDEFIWPALKVKVAKLRRPKESDEQHPQQLVDPSSIPTSCPCAGTVIGQEEYEEDHAKEEIMFEQINSTLRRLKGSFRYYHVPQNQTDQSRKEALYIIRQAILLLKKQIDNLVKHLREHLEKEETECLPIVKKHLSTQEIKTLVGNIMGKRSAEVMTNILNLAVCSLPAEERADMVTHMKNAMKGTFFEQWLEMGGWDGGQEKPGETSGSPVASPVMRPRSSSSCSLKRKLPGLPGINEDGSQRKKMTTTRDSRSRGPSRCYRKGEDGKISLVWCSKSTNPDIIQDVPVFTQAELTPTYHFSSTQGGPVLGCDHYARACKLRHPITGTLHTCRICYQEQRDATRTSGHNPAHIHPSLSDSSSLHILDRNAVTEILCMKCGALQPVGKSCINSECTPKQPFARYSCTLCRLYDDAPNKHIYHCPFCNSCRLGRGLGLDFRHCMRCNACVSIDQYEDHTCIPQRLQGNCPICQVELFDSTEPLRGMRCGHVMHLSCFNRYMASCDNSRRKLTCPVCKVAVDSLRG